MPSAGILHAPNLSGCASCSVSDRPTPIIIPALMDLPTPYGPGVPARKTRFRSRLHVSVMPIRTRKLLGTIALLVLVVIWSPTGMGAADHADRQLDVAAGRLARAILKSFPLAIFGGFQKHFSC
jgi:hypothetical protein